MRFTGNNRPALPLAVALVAAFACTSDLAHGDPIFVYDPIPQEDIVSAWFSMDVAAMVAHRYIGPYEVNFVHLLDFHTGLPALDLSDELFGTASWPDPDPPMDQGDLETGIVTAGIPASWFQALAADGIGIYATLTDTDDAMFAIDFLSLTIETTDGSVQAYYGWPVGNENNGFGLDPPIPDNGPLPAPLPISIPPGATGTGFDETISSKTIPPEPASLLLFGVALLALPRCRRWRACLPALPPVRAWPGRGAGAPLALLACLLLTAPALAVPEVVFAGDDCWATPAGGATYDFSVDPIPADFFGPGSLPFGATIYFHGLPIATEPPGVLGMCDTIVRRLNDTIPLEVGDSDTITLEIVALSLAGTITVDFAGGATQDWDVRVCLSPTALQPTGEMTITRDQEDGGYFYASFGVIPRFYFTPADGGSALELDCGCPEYAGICDGLILENADGEPNFWVLAGPGHIDPPDFGVVTFGSDIAFDGTCEGTLAGLTVGSSNAIPGLKAVGGGHARCWLNKEAEGALAANKGNHGNRINGNHDSNNDNIADECEGACCLLGGDCVELVTEEMCAAMDGVYLGDRSTCPATCVPDQLHVEGPIPNRVPAGRGSGTIAAVVEVNFVPWPGREVVFSKMTGGPLTGAYHFASGTISPDGTQATATTDENGVALMVVVGDAEGPALVQVHVSGTDLSGFSFFFIVPAPNSAPAWPQVLRSLVGRVE